ncbi:MAG: S-layer homology domain-containing protein [Oscillibacter sp.]|nr:S-layer homology domain-containing protein [Oscillibacter sp.]
MNKTRLQRITAALCTLCLLITFLPRAYAADVEAYALNASNSDITYTVAPGEAVKVNAEDFRAFFYASCQTDTFRYVTFEPDGSLKASNGILYCDYGTETETAFTRNMLQDARFYDRSSMYGAYPLETLSFVANRQAAGNAVTLAFRAYGDSENCAGQVSITVQGAAPVQETATPAPESSIVDLTWHVTAGDTLRFDRNDFRDFFRDHASRDEEFRYLTFQPDASFSPENGYLYYDFEGQGQKQFTTGMLQDAKFFHSSSRYGSYPLSGMTFLAANEAGGNLVRFPFSAYGRTEHYDGTLVIQINWARVSDKDTNPAPVYGPTLPSASAAADTPTPTPATDTQTPDPGTSDAPDMTAAPVETKEPDIVYLVRAGERVEFSLPDFSTPAKEKLKGTFRYVTFSTKDTLSAETGFISADIGGLEETIFTSENIEKIRFYADSDKYGDYALKSLLFSAPVTAAARTVHFECTLYDSKQASAVITMSIEIQAAAPEPEKPGDGDTTPAEKDTSGDTTPAEQDTSGDTVSTEPGKEPETANSGDTVSTEPGKEPETANSGDTVPTEPGKEPETANSGDTVPDEPKPGEPVEMPHEAVNITEPFTGTPVAAGNLLYAATWNTPFRFVSDDFERFFRKTFPGGTISHVSFSALPEFGKLVYDYYASSAYGDSPRTELLFGNLPHMRFYFSPAYTDRYSLAELTYVPVVEKNFCETVPFSATGLDAHENIVQCTGNVLISVTKELVADVYGAIPKGRTVTFPASNLLTNVKAGTGVDIMNGFRLLELPEASTGAVVVGSGQSPADTAQIYHWTDITPKVSDLRFVPNPDFIGSVDIPYLMVDGDANPTGIGHFTLGVISTLKRFDDMTSSVWCYKYVTELADAGVIGGYEDNTYRPGASVTWGAALKLIMLAAGYTEQKGTTMSPFQGYMEKAIDDGLIPREVDLWEPITRLEVAELTAAAMKLDTSHLSSVQPFTDTDNTSVKALNAAGIINGYYEEGVSTFRPSGTLNRGQVSAIIWRMRNYKG